MEAQFYHHQAISQSWLGLQPWNMLYPPSFAPKASVFTGLEY